MAGGSFFESIPILGPVTSTLFLPLNQSLEQINSARQYKFNRAQPMVLPPVDLLIDCYLRRIGEGDTPFQAKWIDMALQYHGVNLGQNFPELGKGALVQDEALVCGYHAWRHAFTARQAVPGIGEILDAHRRGLEMPLPVRQMLRRAGADVDRMLAIVPWLYDRPGIGDVLDALVKGRITPDEAERLAREAGTRLPLWEWSIPARQATFGPADLIALRNRELIDDTMFDERLHHAGFHDSGDRALWDYLRRALPGVADLNMFGIRHSWQPELVEQYGYYLEFPERLRPWYAKLGLDYGVGFQARTDQGVREVTLADAYWASHWHVLPLASAFAAYQRFQPDLVRRFQEDNPALRPFTRDDLDVHMRQADFPPGVRDWLVALAHPVLGTRVIQQGAQFLGWDRAELQSRYRLLGYTTDDAATLARLAEARQAAREQAWLKTIETRAHQQTVHMIEGLYTDGTIDRPFALRQLSDAGLSDVVSTQLLDIADFGVERSLVRAAVAATSRDFLSGVLSRADAETQLRRIGIQDARIVNYLAAWGIQRSARRKRIETGKVASMVSAGLLGPDEARARLANLQWSDPDATLLLAEAEGKLAKRLAAEEKSAQTNARQRAKELERLAKDAESQSRKLRAEANRIAPRSALTKWVVDGIIDDDTFRAMMRDRGYDDVDIERYLKDAKQPKPRPPKPSPTSPPWPRPKGSAHAAQARLAKWLKDGIIDIEDYRDGLTDLGYSDSDVARFVRDASPAGNGQAQGPPAGPQAPQA